MYAGGKAALQSGGEGEAWPVNRCLIGSKERMQLRKGLWKFFFFHKPFTRLFGFFVHLFPVEETALCLGAREAVISRREKFSAVHILGLGI